MWTLHYPGSLSDHMEKDTMFPSGFHPTTWIGACDQETNLGVLGDLVVDLLLRSGLPWPLGVVEHSTVRQLELLEQALLQSPVREVTAAPRCPLPRESVFTFHKHQAQAEILKWIWKKRILRTTVSIYNNKLQRTHKSPSVLWSIPTEMTTWRSVFCAAAHIIFMCVAPTSPSVPQTRALQDRVFYCAFCTAVHVR